jgi:hypothetical protein
MPAFRGYGPLFSQVTKVVVGLWVAAGIGGCGTEEGHRLTVGRVEGSARETVARCVHIGTVV